MGVSTVAIGVLPTYAMIGLTAPLLLALCRFGQGLGLGGEWGDTGLPLPGGAWRNCFTDQVIQREISPAELFGSFPVALLIRDST